MKTPQVPPAKLSVINETAALEVVAERIKAGDHDVRECGPLIRRCAGGTWLCAEMDETMISIGHTPDEAYAAWQRHQSKIVV